MVRSSHQYVETMFLSWASGTCFVQAVCAVLEDETLQKRQEIGLQMVGVPGSMVPSANLQQPFERPVHFRGKPSIELAWKITISRAMPGANCV